MQGLNRLSAISEVAYLWALIAVLIALLWKHDGIGGNPEGVIYLVAQNPPGRDNAHWLVQEDAPNFSRGEKDRIWVRKGERVVLRITSIDNVHGFSLPAYDLEEVVYPGEMAEVSFIADMPGEYYFSCTIFCGDKDHSKMKGRLVVEAP